MVIAFILQLLKKLRTKEPLKSRPQLRVKSKPFQCLIPFIALLTFTCVLAIIYYEIEVSLCPTEWGSLDYYSNSSEDLTYWKAFHFIATIESTIGFGDIKPCSVWGQLLTIATAFFGIPLSLICLTKMGHTFELALNKFWLGIKKMTTRRKSKVYTLEELKGRKNNEDKRDNDDESELIVVPISFGLFVTFLWIGFCSVYFYYTLRSYYADKNFTIFTAFYFTIVTFFTIGLGDISPVQYEYVLITSLFIMIGLALVTMCIELIQDKLEIFFDNVVKLIQAQYRNRLLMEEEDQPGMADDPNLAKIGVRQLIDQNRSTLLKHFLSKKNERKLIGEYRSKAKMIVKGTQHDIVQTEQETSTDDVQSVDKETMTDRRPSTTWK